MSQFEAVLAPLQKCSMSLQSDSVGISSCSLVEIYHSRQQILNMKKPLAGERIQGGLLVLSTNLDDYPDRSIPWDGSITIHKLEKQRVAIAYESVLLHAKYLIARLLREYLNYFNEEHHPHAELSILANPFLADLVPYCLLDLGVYKEDDIPRVKKLYVDEMVKVFYVERNANETPPPAAASTAHEDFNESSEDEAMSPARRRRGDDFSGFALRMRLQRSALASYTAGTNAVPGDAKEPLRAVCQAEHDQYMKNSLEESQDLAKWIKEFPTEKFNTDSKQWGTDLWRRFHRYCYRKNYLEIAKYFDVLAWWEKNKSRYPRIFVVAMIWLGVPATNAFQEREFSRCAWYDSNRLMNKQSARSFEQRVLDSSTRSLIDNVIKREAVLKEKAARERMARGDEDDIEGDDGAAAANDAERRREMSECIEAQNIAIMLLSKQVQMYNQSEKMNLPGPTVSAKYINDADVIADMNDVRLGLENPTEKEEEPGTEPTLDPEADNDKDLDLVEQERAGMVPVDNSSVVEVLVQRPLVSISSKTSSKTSSQVVGGTTLPFARPKASIRSAAGATHAYSSIYSTEGAAPGVHDPKAPRGAAGGERPRGAPEPFTSINARAAVAKKDKEVAKAAAAAAKAETKAAKAIARADKAAAKAAKVGRGRGRGSGRGGDAGGGRVDGPGGVILGGLRGPAAAASAFFQPVPTVARAVPRKQTAANKRKSVRAAIDACYSEDDSEDDESSDDNVLDDCRKQPAVEHVVGDHRKQPAKTPPSKKAKLG
jgi:hypothetical protein